MTTREEQQAPSHIKETSDGERPYIIHPEDNDLFVRTGRQVIEGCRLSISVEVWMKELDEMFLFIHSWIQKCSKQIIACYAVPRNVVTAIFFVPKSQTFDFDLADLLAELSIKLQKFNVGPVEIHQIPEDELNRFIIPEMCAEIYSNVKKPHHTVAS
jgi:hypothetical protein